MSIHKAVEIETIINGFYIRDKHPCKRKIGVQKVNAEKIFVSCYDSKTGKHEGKWCNRKDLLGADS